MAILLHVHGWDPEPWVARFREGAPAHRIVTEVDAATRNLIHYAMVWKPDPGLLSSIPNLKVIFNLGAGVDAILTDETIPKSIPIVRVVDPNLTMRMTEWILLQVLIHHRGTLTYLDQQRRRLWQDRTDQPAARHVTVGILGLGELGRDAARALRAVRFRVAGWSRSPKTLEGVETFHGEAGLDAMLAATDILVCLLPLTPETRGFLNLALFRRLKRNGPLGGPILINAGRGPEQIETDILSALDDGTLQAASLDVFETEPLPASSPLWSHPRVIVTPHNAADSEPKSLARYVLKQIAQHESGLSLENVVDRARGY